MRVEPAAWDDPDVQRLASDQQTEIRARYGGKEEPGATPSAADIGLVLVARDDDRTALVESGHGMGHDDLARAVLARYGTTFAEEAGIPLADEQETLFQLLTLAQLLSARIGAGVAVGTARELFAAGWTSPARLRAAGRGLVVGALGRGGYRRYDERTATQLREMATLVLDRYAGDLRGLAMAADGDPGRASALVQEVKGIGPTGADVFLREVQGVWPWVRPYLDDRARAGARRIGLPDDARLAGLVAPTDLARFAAALVRVSRVPAGRDPLDG